ncbi:Uncharacterised protein [uncultured Ruminococcus sp.]|nr:Uncharacterised protein [uncultured Ruminococcus sp.]
MMAERKIGYRLSAIGYRLSAIGYRLSAIGYRLSAIGGLTLSISLADWFFINFQMFQKAYSARLTAGRVCLFTSQRTKANICIKFEQGRENQ